MTVKEAYEIIKKENPGMKAIQCFDFADFYAFALAEESWNGELLGGAAEVVNCRCALLQRARQALDEYELETLKQRAEYFGLDKADSFEDFKKKYVKASEQFDIEVDLANLKNKNAVGKSVDAVKKGLTKSSNDDITEVGKSVGAKAKNYDVELPNKEIVHLTEGTRITNIETIAGKGRSRKIDEVALLLEKYGDSESEWQKKKGFGYVDYDGESYLAKLHWFEEPSAGRHKWKVKPDADGNWFKDDDN